MIDDPLTTAVNYLDNRHTDGQPSKQGMFRVEEYDGTYLGALRLVLAQFRVFRFNRDASLPIRQAGVTASGFPLVVTISTSVPVINDYI